MLPAQPCEIKRVSKPVDIAWATFVTGTTSRIFKLPVNAKIVDAGYFCEDLDSGATFDIDIDITDGTVVRQVVDSNTVGQTGGYYGMATNGTSPITEGADSAFSALGYVIPDVDFYMLVTFVAVGDQDKNLQFFVSYTNILEAGESN